jgi:hypothetical protein
MRAARLAPEVGVGFALRCGALAVDDDGRLWRYSRPRCRGRRTLKVWRCLGPIELEPEVPPGQLVAREQLLDAWRSADDRDDLVAEARSAFMRSVFS